MLGANVFTPVFILINGSAPQAALGAVNGFAQTPGGPVEDCWATDWGRGVEYQSGVVIEDWAQHASFRTVRCGGSGDVGDVRGVVVVEEEGE